MSEPTPVPHIVYTFTFTWDNNRKFFGTEMPILTDEEALALGVYIRDNLSAMPEVMIEKVTSTTFSESLTLPPPESPPEP